MTVATPVGLRLLVCMWRHSQSVLKAAVRLKILLSSDCLVKNWRVLEDSKVGLTSNRVRSSISQALREEVGSSVPPIM